MTISSSNQLDADVEITPDAAEEDVYIFPASYAQQRLWFLQQFDPQSAAYNIPAAFRLVGPLNVEALEQGFSEIVRRHETLRTLFALVEEQVVQVVFPTAPLTRLPVRDLQSLPEAERNTVVIQSATEEAQRPFDLIEGPLLRLSLLRLGEQEHVLLLTMHHIISDGWSTGVFIKEMAVLYEAFAQGQP